MKIKLLPFNEAKKKAIENDIITDEYEIIGISKGYWGHNGRIVKVHKENGRFYIGEFFFPKCCCEVIENEKSNS